MIEKFSWRARKNSKEESEEVQTLLMQ
jgi:hypothetical protein